MDQTAESVLGWLRKGGYPLEYYTSRSLQSAGFRAEQGRHYLDPQHPGTNREVDVLAFLDGAPAVPVVLVFECKSAFDKPWVVLTTEIQARATEPIAGIALAGVLGDGHVSEHIVRDNLPLPSPHGFSVVEAHNDRNDRAHSAMEQVVSAAVGIQQQLGRLESVFAMPVVVTEAPLFRFESPDGGEDSVTSILWERIRWNGSQAHPRPTLVDVVTREGLPSYLVVMREQVLALQNALGVFTRH